MKSEILSRFDEPLIPILGLIIFLAVFLLKGLYTLNPKRKSHFEELGNIPFHDLDKK
jgi:cbb3-type cytochrome oxidase subunit 3